jgi:hypothetical protein
MVLTRGTKEQAAPKLPIFTLKMATATFAETLNNIQHSMYLIPERQSCRYENLWTNLRIGRYYRMEG